MDTGWGLALRLPWMWLVQRLPGWIVSRFWSVDAARDRFDVDLRSLRGLGIIRTAIPEVEISLRFINRNPFDVNVYRVHFPDIWFGQPVLTNVQLQYDCKVPANAVVPPFRYDRSGVAYRDMPVYFRLQIGKDGLDWILSQVKNGKLESNPTLAIDVYAKSVVGDFVKKDVYIEVPAHQVGGL